jgi:hypothetical protein
MKETVNEYRIEGFPLKVTFRHKSIHIPNTEELKTFLSKKTESRTTELIAMIKRDYLLIHHEAIDISDESMAVEIWAHLFAQNFQPVLGRLADFTITEWLAERLLKSAENIDLGESSVDNNRKYWDWLSSHKDFILSILFRGNN